MTDQDYIKIDWPDVRAGDVLMHENGDRLTVTEVRSFEVNRITSFDLRLATGWWHTAENLTARGFSPYRKAEPLPTQRGAYHDRDGIVCFFDGAKSYPTWFIDGSRFRPDHMRRRAPFTRLVPMPNEQQVYSAIARMNLSRFADDSKGWEPQVEELEKATAAVMALLRDDASSTEVES